MNKIFGIGIPSTIGISLFTILTIISLKVIFNKYPNRGTDFINTI
jgi:hypothetical protein